MFFDVIWEKKTSIAVPSVLFTGDFLQFTCKRQRFDIRMCSKHLRVDISWLGDSPSAALFVLLSLTSDSELVSS
jgi:hypothetical protein